MYRKVGQVKIDEQCYLWCLWRWLAWEASVARTEGRVEVNHNGAGGRTASAKALGWVWLPLDWRNSKKEPGHVANSEFVGLGISRVTCESSGALHGLGVCMGSFLRTVWLLSGEQR